MQDVRVSPYLLIKQQGTMDLLHDADTPQSTVAPALEIRHNNNVNTRRNDRLSFVKWTQIPDEPALRILNSCAYDVDQVAFIRPGADDYLTRGVRIVE